MVISLVANHTKKRKKKTVTCWCYYKESCVMCVFVCVGVLQECGNCQVIRVHVEVCGAAGKAEQQTVRETDTPWV